MSFVDSGPDDWIASTAQLAPPRAAPVAAPQRVPDNLPDDWITPPAAPQARASDGLPDDWITPAAAPRSAPMRAIENFSSNVDAAFPTLGAARRGAQFLAQAAEDFRTAPPAEKAQPSKPDDGYEIGKGFVGGLVGTNPKLAGDAMQGLGLLLEDGDLVRRGAQLIGATPLGAPLMAASIAAPAAGRALQDAGQSVSQFGQEQLENYKPRVPSITSVRTDSLGNAIEDIGSYAGYQTGNVAASSAPALVAGLPAGLLARNPRLASAMAAGGASYVQNFGDVYGSARDDEGIKARVARGEITPRQVAGTAAFAAIPMAALDAYGFDQVVGKNLFGEAKHDLLRRMVHGMGTGALTEGATEGAQDIISQWAQDWLGSNTTAYQKLVSVVDNALGGFLGGGATAAVTSATPGRSAAPAPAPAPAIPADAIPAADVLGAAPVAPQVDPSDVPSVSQPGVVTPAEQIPQQNQQQAPGVVTDAAPAMAPDESTIGELANSARPPQFPVRSLEDILNDPRSAAEIRGEMEAAANWQPTDQWQDVPRGAALAPGLDIQVDPATGQQRARIMPTPGTREAPVRLETPADVLTGAEQTAQPTPAQAAAGNYAMRHVKWSGLDISVETEAGQQRTGVGADGKPWTSTAPAPYGYVRGTEGRDGDHVDVTLGPNPQAPTVFVVDQIDPDNLRFDEHKAFIGFPDETAARAAYEGSFSDGSGGMRAGAVTPMSVPEFKAWLAGDTRKPLAYEAPRAPRKAAQRGPLSLFEFLAQNGGIRDHGGELRSMGLDRAFVPGFGRLVRPNGRPLDMAREAATEAGYIPGEMAGGDSTTINHLLDLLGQEASGAKVFSQRDLAEVADRAAARAQKESAQDVRKAQAEVRAVAKDQGINATEAEIKHAARLATEQGMDLGDALVTVVEASYYGGYSDLVASQPQEAVHAANDATGTDQGRTGLAPTSEQPSRPEPLPAQERPPDRVQSGEAQRDRGAQGPQAAQRPTGTEPAKPAQAVEATPAGAQHVLPGAEKAPQGEQAQRKADQPLKPKVAQKEAGGKRFNVVMRDTDAQEIVGGVKIVASLEQARRAARQMLKGPEPAAAAAPAKPPEPSTTKAPSAGPSDSGRTIEDFGEKIEGARKDTFAGFRDSLKEEMDVAAEPLSKSFPQPDYEKLAAGGVSRRALAYIAIMRDMIPPKPRQAWKVRQWVTQVSALRNFARQLLDKDIDVATLNEAARKNHILRDLPLTAEAIEDVAPADLPKAAEYRMSPGSYSVLYGKRYSPSKTFWHLEGPKRRMVSNPFSNDPAMDYSHRETPEEAVALAKKIIAHALAKADEAKPPERSKYTEVNVFRDRAKNEVFLGFKVRSTVLRLKAGFDSVKSAREYLQENRDQLQATIDEMRQGPNMRGTENRPRSGAALREGDVSPESFSTAFGFRGVQFGNYVEGGRRQEDLNRAFDALMDLADVLGIPPQALSLNGSLGLAFGARGHGGRDAAAAHYEPGQVVINLTKGGGPGSLAHEWLHALDNYFARQDAAGGYISERKRDKGPVRDQVYQAWKAIEASLAKGSFADRSAEFDKARSKPYWGTTIEKAARAFERYVVDRMSDKGAVNDYLANIDTAGGAYPTEKEMQSLGIRAAYDQLFNAIETKPGERPGTVAMYSLHQPRMLGIPAAASEPVATFRNDRPLKVHSDYKAAKAGDHEAAARLVQDLVKPENIAAARERFGSGAIYAPVLAEEATGDNAIPALLATYYAQETGAQVSGDVTQVNRAFHTGAGAMERLAARAQFDGDVQRGGRYVLVDDVSVMGSTIAEMANHIRANGGEVVGVVTLVNAGRSGVLAPVNARLTAIKRRFGDAIKDLFGIEPSGLTADEADYILNFRDADALRSRQAASQLERGDRLRSKGLQEEVAQPKSENASGAPSGAVSDSGVETTGGKEEAQYSLGADLTPAAKQRRADLETMLSQLVEKLVGRNAKVEFADTIPVNATGWGSHAKNVQTAAGVYIPARALIRLALADPAYTGNPTSTAFHESFHAVENQLLTQNEFDLLKRETERLRKFLNERVEGPAAKSTTWANELADYEVRAIAFEMYAMRRAQGKPLTGLHTGIARTFGKLFLFLQRVRNALSGLGFKTAEDIFSDVYQGKMAGRSPMRGPNVETAAVERSPDDYLEGNIPVFHGTSEDFDKLDISKARNSYERAIFFSDDEKEAAGYGDRVVKAWLPKGRGLIVDRAMFDHFGASGDPVYQLINYAKGQHFNDYVVFDLGGERTYAVFNQSAIKYTEPPRRADRPQSSLGTPQLREPGLAAERSEVMQSFLARGQPIDRALRIPFDVFGGLTRTGEWKPGQKISEKATHVISGAKFSPDSRFAFMNPVLETVRSGLIDRYNLRDLPGYVERERGRSLDERANLLKANEILRSMQKSGVGLAEARVMHAMITDGTIGPQELSRLAEPIQAAIEEWGQEAVQYGLISRESFERYRGVYMNRSYRKHELDQNGLVRMVNKIGGSFRKRIIGNQLKGRGLFEEIPLARLMRDVPDWHEGARGTPENGEKFIRLDEMSTQEEADVGGEAPPEKTLRTVYWPADRAIPDRYSGFRNQGVWEVRGTKNGKPVLWRDFTKEERTDMGEILDARYTFAKTALQAAHDLSVGKFYWDIAQNQEWARSTKPDGRVIDAAEWQRGGNAYKKQSHDWVRVPNTEITNTGGKKKYGALADKWVREEIWRDLHEIEVATNPNALASLWRAIMTQWKLNKTARSPTVHINNVMSNFFLMDLMDVRMQDLIGGIRGYATGDANYQEAFEHGAFGSDMISKEIRENTLNPILKEIAQQLTAAPAGRAGALGQMSKFTDLLWTALKKADAGMRWAYQVEDEVFRMAAYNRRRQLGDTPKQAADAAREQFIDYDIHAPWIRAARNTVLPFISYTYRAAPIIANAVATRPWKIAKYAMLAYAANAIAYALSGGDEDKERRSLREQEQGRTWLGSYRMTRMPFNDKNGHPMFLDMRNWVPAGNVFDFGDGDIPQWMFLGGPLVIGAELATNRSTFTGQEIFNSKTDDWWDRQSLRAAYAFKAAAPNAPWIPGSYAWDKISAAARGGTDRGGTPYSLPVAAINSVGLKLKPQDVQDAMASKGQEIESIERALESKARRLASQRTRNLISESYFDSEMAGVYKKMERLGAKAVETFKD